MLLIGHLDSELISYQNIFFIRFFKNTFSQGSGTRPIFFNANQCIFKEFSLHDNLMEK